MASETAVEMSLLAVRSEMRELGLSAVGRSCRCWRLAGGEKAGSVGWRRRLGRSAVGFVSSVLAGEGRVCGGWFTEMEGPVVVAQVSLLAEERWSAAWMRRCPWWLREDQVRGWFVDGFCVPKEGAAA